ncbi:MAG: methyltransferase [Planctomycetota bacterium]|nr:methyltransferase [Planctomycetota bacterium]
MRSPLLTRVIFGVEVLPLSPGDRYFDSATLAMRHVLARGRWKATRVIEIGTGSSALIARWIVKAKGWRVAATELDSKVAQRARENLQAFGRDHIEVHEGQLFADVSGAADLVIFNPPFVPSAVGAQRGLSEDLRTQWDGGEDGTRVLREFLRAYSERGQAREALVAINVHHAPEHLVEECLAAHENLRLSDWYSAPWTPARVARVLRQY